MARMLVFINPQEGFRDVGTDNILLDIQNLINNNLDNFDMMICTKFVPCLNLNYSRLLGLNLSRFDTRFFEEIKAIKCKIAQISGYSFLSQNLKTYINSNGIDEIYFVGYEGEMFLLNFMSETFNMGIKPYVYENCLFGTSLEEHNFNMSKIRNSFGEKQIL